MRSWSAKNVPASLTWQSGAFEDRADALALVTQEFDLLPYANLLRDGENTVVQVPRKIQINDGMALVAAACAGGGILAIDRLLVDQELASGALVPVLPAYSLRPGQPIYAVYPARPWLAFKTAMFVSYLQGRLLA